MVFVVLKSTKDLITKTKDKRWRMLTVSFSPYNIPDNMDFNISMYMRFISRLEENKDHCIETWINDPFAEKCCRFLQNTPNTSSCFMKKYFSFLYT